MATKKDSIQEGRTQNVSTPQSEPAAANVTIPRRDLLTGAALVLIGSASGSNEVLAATCRHPHKLRTDFMAAFTDKFIGASANIPQPGCDSFWPDLHHPPQPGDPPRLFPTAGRGTADIVGDYTTFVKVLLTVVTDPGTDPTAPGFTPNPALAATIVKFLKDQHWPNGTPPPPIPSEYSTERDLVNLVEIAVIQDRLLQAINTFGGPGAGGGGSNWPPH